MLQRLAKQVARPAPASSGAEPLLAPPSRPATAAERPRLRFSDLAIDAPRARPSRPNRTGLPDRLKSGIEALSGVSLDAVKVRYNSPAPARLGALAYAQGREIHLGAGQEHHLPHEAWHLVQQAQGRVRPTGRLDGKLAVNDDRGLEGEADRMGAKARSVGGRGLTAVSSQRSAKLPLLGERGGPAVLQPLRDAEQFEQHLGQRGKWGGLRSAFTDPHLKAAHAAIGRYHSVSWWTKQKGTRAVNEHKLAALHAAQHSLYAYQGAHLANPEDPQSENAEKHRKTVKEVQNEIQAAHRSHIATSVNLHHPLWTPDAATMKPAERQRVANLWSSVTTGVDKKRKPSHLTVHDESLPGVPDQPAMRRPGFREEINANHARLLETPGGRDLVESLVRGPHRVDVRPAHQDDEADIAYAYAGRTKAVPESRLERDREARASAVDRPFSGDHFMVHRPKHAGGPGVRSRYDLGAGTSSRVIVNPGILDSTNEHRDVTTHDVSRDGKRVPTPAFLIYGHELGHAQNMMRGAAKMAMRPDLYEPHQIHPSARAARIALGTDNVVPEHQQLLMHWHNAEEHDNIERVENRLRDEHGLPRRKYH